MCQRTLEEEVLIRTNKTSTCWIWTGGTCGDNYGVFRRKRAHRLAYELWKEPIPKNMLVRHLCHTKLCINPDHLDIGTHQDNANDRLYNIINN